MKDGKERVRKVVIRASSASVVEVIPIVKGLLKPTLSYFTTKEVLVGEFVKIPLRKGEATAIIVAVHDAERSKTDLKSSSYALKRLTNIGAGKYGKQGERKSEPDKARISTLFMNAALKTSHYYAASIGSILDTLLPNIILDEPQLVFSRHRDDASEDASGPINEPLLLQLEHAERFSQYKSIIREALAKKTSVMFIAPTEEEASRAFEFLSHGINEYAYLFTLNQKPKDLRKTLEAAGVSERPVLFVTTPSGISFNRPDLLTIILERENSRAYRTLSRPFIHLRVFLEYFIQHTKKRLILGDSVLSIETLWKEREGKYKDFFPLKWRIATSSHTVLVDMKAIQRETKQFEIFSPEVRTLIAKAIEEEEKVFLFGARKGLAPTTICEDCGSILSCKNCGAPVVLHDKRSSHKDLRVSTSETAERIYLCHACRARRPSETTCDTCQSWRLSAIGIGVDRIALEVADLFPDAKVQILDKTHANTDAKVKRIVNQFKDEGQILVGTELAFLHLEKVPYVALVSVDSLFSIPDFSIHERVFYLTSRLREMSEKEMIIQTRNIGKMVLTWASTGNILDFYKEEIAERKELSYPPFSIFIKISPLSPEAAKNMADLKSQFARWSPDLVKDSIVMRLPREKWPDADLLSELSLLTLGFSIKVDPETIL